MAQYLKQTTGLTGLAVAKHPLQTLTHYYERILVVLEKMPAEAAYRRSTEAVVKHRLQVVSTETNVEKVEDKINGGQAEELIQQAKGELSLARKMLQWQPWTKLVAEAPPNQWKWPV